MMTNDPELLLEFSRNHSEEAFRALVRQHSPVVFSAALRKLNGDRAAAQDVTQEVFTLLVRKASRLEGVVLPGWLYRQACRRASNHVRTESRRKRREQAAMETMKTFASDDSSATRALARELDDAMLHLSATDRDALVLRFFEGREYNGVGKALGLGEEAARKRVRRALDRLAVIFKRKGIAVSGVSLGTAMEAFGAPPVSASLVSQISSTALKAGPCGSIGLISLLKPLVAGVVATSLAAGTTLALRPPQGNKATAATPPPSSSSTKESRSARLTGNLPENPTLEQIITEIRRVRSGPGNSLTTMRLHVALRKIGFERIPAFIALANESLNKAEREAVYLPLMSLWWAKEPEAALTFILDEKVDDWVHQAGTYNLLQNCFRIWTFNNPRGSEEWLLRNWNQETLAEIRSGRTFRNKFSTQIAGKLFSDQGASSALDFAARLPTVEDQARAFQSLVGLDQSDSIWEYSDNQKDRWRELYRGIEKLPDERWRRELTRAFWKEIGENQPERFEEIRNFIAPSDPLIATLGLLSVRQTHGERVDNLDGSFSFPAKPVSDRDLREAAAVEAGQAAGLSRAETLAAIGETLSKVVPSADFLAWFDSHRDEVDLDDLLIDKVRGMSNSTGYLLGQEMEAISWASRISDVDLRRVVCRGAFRRLLASKPDSARGYLDGTGIPADLSAEFHEILNETP